MPVGSNRSKLKWISIPDQATALYVTILYTGQLGNIRKVTSSDNIHWPGMTPAQIHKKTVHFDIAPSLLKHALGCEDTPPENVASDFGLFTDRSKNWTIAHSYMSHALILDDAMVVTGPRGHVDVLDPHLKPKASFTATAGLVSDVLHELSRFNTN